MGKDDDAIGAAASREVGDMYASRGKYSTPALDQSRKEMDAYNARLKPEVITSRSNKRSRRSIRK